MAAQTVSTHGINRREFLYYLGGASAAILAAGSCGVINMILTPHLRLGVEIFEVDPSQVLALDSDSSPIWIRDFNTYLNRDDQGLLALNAHCTFRDQYKLVWVETNYRFECPGCGSKFQKDGTYIEGPAPRSLDRFMVEVTTPNGAIRTPDDGSAVNIEGATRIVVNTQEKILGPPRGR